MSARLSPAASLLRNSKLFAIPPTIALPPTPASAEQIASSATATSIYPQHAAIKTTLTSHNYGDWGFKRPLPHRSTKATNNPVVRLVNGIDTREQIADFESAADHVLTRRKFEELNMPLQHMPADRRDSAMASRSSYGIENGKHQGVFRPTHDNTTNLSAKTSPAYAPPSGVWPDLGPDDIVNNLPSAIQKKHLQMAELRTRQSEKEAAAKTSSDEDSGNAKLEQMLAPPSKRVEQKRWRYNGPSLSQISGQEFEGYLRKIDKAEVRVRLIEKARDRMLAEERRRAREEGSQDEVAEDRIISEEELRNYIRYLRKTPSVFGPMIAEVLDLPEVMIDTDTSRRRDVWEYGRQTLASDQWLISGLPKTHPSAGLSYVHTNQHVTNDPEYGPQKERDTTVARAVRSRVAQDRPVLGVAGFIVPDPQGHTTHKDKLTFEPKQGGIKAALRPTVAYIQSNATLKMHTEHVSHVVDENEKAISSAENQRRKTMEELRQVTSPQPMPQLSGGMAQSSKSAGTQQSANHASNARQSPDIQEIFSR